MRMDHMTLQTNDLEGTKDIFCDVLELHPGRRPPFDFPGYWLYNKMDEHPVIHLIGITDDVTPETGTLHHMAFLGEPQRYDEFDAKIATLDVKQDRRVVPSSGIRQIFVTGPHNIFIELNFPEA
ncbi:MAG: hypothetical protein VW405_07670 [Rhodospirillaceae bacterium]